MRPCYEHIKPRCLPVWVPCPLTLLAAMTKTVTARNVGTRFSALSAIVAAPRDRLYPSFVQHRLVYYFVQIRVLISYRYYVCHMMQLIRFTTSALTPPYVIPLLLSACCCSSQGVGLAASEGRAHHIL